jgi:hypothetical protein
MIYNYDNRWGNRVITRFDAIAICKKAGFRDIALGLSYLSHCDDTAEDIANTIFFLKKNLHSSTWRKS